MPETLERIDPKNLRCANPSVLVEAHLGVFWAGFVTGRLDWESAVEIFRRALTIADEAGGAWEQGWLRYLLGYAARSQGDMTGARAWQEAAGERFTGAATPTSGGGRWVDTTFGVWPHYELGWIDMTEDAVASALEHFRHGRGWSTGRRAPSSSRCTSGRRWPWPRRRTGMLPKGSPTPGRRWTRRVGWVCRGSSAWP